MTKTDLRARRELHSSQRRRNAAVVRVLSPILVLVFALNTTMNVLSAAEKHGADAAPWFIAMTSFQAGINLILTLIAYLMPRIHRHYASEMLFVLGVSLLGSQAVMLHFSTEHPAVILVVELAALGALYQMPMISGAVYHVLLYAIAVAGALTGDHTAVPFFPTSIGAPVLGIMMLFVQNRLTRQNLKIREQTAALARGNAENLKSLREVRSLKAEQDRILDTVEEGLFLIDPELRIGSQSSSALASILELENVAGKPALEIFSRGYPDDVNRDLEKFLKLMFRPTLPEKTLEQLNPLGEVRFMPATAADETPREKHLQFRFTRVLDDKKITGLMATVQDITARRRLEETVAQQEEEARAQMELLFSLVHVEPDMLHQFLEEVKANLEEVNQRFRVGGDKREILAETFRRMHSIKGNASVLNLDVFAQRAHAFEEAVKAVHDKEKISGGDLLPLTLKLSDFRKLIEDVEELIERLLKFQNAFEGEKGDARNLLVRGLEQMIERLSDELNKSVRLVKTDFDSKEIPIRLITLIREALVQMTRNSLVHGIESPSERESLGKDGRASIEISTARENGNLRITYRDDGRGLRVDKIKARALAAGTRTPESVAGMSPAQLANLIFEPGFSTAEKEDLNAGRGIGLDLVRTSLSQFQGSVHAVTSPGKFCEFQMLIPAE